MREARSRDTGARGEHDVIIVGGGIAGLSVAWHLARAGVETCLLEREWACGTHASGTNAAIFRHFDTDATAVTLALRSRELMDILAPGLVRRTGALYLASDARLDQARRVVGPLGLRVEWLAARDVAARFPILARGALAGAFVPDDGVIDTHALLEALKRELRDRGGTLRTDAAVTRVDRGDGLHRVRLGDGETLAAPRLVLAGGAWSAELAELAGLRLAIEPRRRHLVLLEPAGVLAASHPVVWRLEDEVYFRPESGGVLASPCDEEPWLAGVHPVGDEQLIRLGERLGGLAPTFATARVRRAWSCLRSFARDGEFVLGSDPRAEGLFWLAGLGGRGMTCGLALGEALSASVLGHESPLPKLSPARLA